MADLIGYTGVFLILLAYFLSVYGKLAQTDRLYLILNLVGAGLACISSILIQSVPFTILEGAWAVVSLIALWKKRRPSF
ncbi:MAG: hypothetical protein JNK77_14690 [Saprospiraceae bacterium]|nr:hypothetical protein [Saprospiraceae bacterium]